MEVILTFVLNHLVELAVAAVVGGLLPLVKKYMRKLDWENAIPLVEDAIDEGAGMVVDRLKKETNDASFMVGSESLGEAIQYVLKTVPEAMKKGGYNQEMVEEKVRARVKRMLEDKG